MEHPVDVNKWYDLLSQMRKSYKFIMLIDIREAVIKKKKKMEISILGLTPPP